MRAPLSTGEEAGYIYVYKISGSSPSSLRDVLMSRVDRECLLQGWKDTEFDETPLSME